MTPQDLKQLDNLLQKRLKEAFQDYPTKDDVSKTINQALHDTLKDYPTKYDVSKMVNQATEEICDTITNFVNAIDEKKADKPVVNKLEKRVEEIEEKIAQAL